MCDVDSVFLDFVFHKVMFDVDVFGSFVVKFLFAVLYSSHVVTVQCGRVGCGVHRLSKVSKKF